MMLLFMIVKEPGARKKQTLQIRQGFLTNLLNLFPINGDLGL